MSPYSIDEPTRFTRRSFIVIALQAVLAFVLIIRLYFLQILNRSHYQLLSDKNRIQTQLIAPERGKITDRLGTVLVENQVSYAALLNAPLVQDLTKTLELLERILSLSPEWLVHVKRRFITHKNRRLVVKENLSWEELAQLELHLPTLTGLEIDKGFRRRYNDVYENFHILGYLSPLTKKDSAFSVFREIPNVKVGRQGLEKIYDAKLRGKPGMKQEEVNATRRVIRTLSLIDPIRGEDFTLTVDRALQRQVYEFLGAYKSACAAVMDVHTGALLAFSSFPGCDANLLSGQMVGQEWKALTQNPDRPLINKLISGQYAPGSTFKMIVALAALKAGIIDENRTCYCPGYHDVGGYRFHCWSWRHGGHGNVNLATAIASSCDVYFYVLAPLLGIERIAEIAQLFGLGTPTGIELIDEKAGLIPSKSWKERFRKGKWTIGDTTNISIGQGYILATPLQLLRMQAMLVNGLRPLTPHLIKKENLAEFTPLSLPDHHMAPILKGMNDAVNQPWGTAYRSRLEASSWDMGGKTGSTQVQRITQRQRDEGTVNTQGYLAREHSLFTGYGPVKNPKVAVMVLVEHGGGGAKAAAPIAKRILEATQKILEGKDVPA